MLAQYFHSLSDEREAAGALARVGMRDRLRHRPRSFPEANSSVCAWLAADQSPQLILADEPTGNLDEVNEALVMGLLTELHEEQYATEPVGYIVGKNKMREGEL